MNYRSFLRNIKRNEHYEEILRNAYVARHSEPRRSNNYDEYHNDSWDTGEDTSDEPIIYMDDMIDMSEEKPLSEDDMYLERMGVAL